MMFMITFKGVLWIIGITALVTLGLYLLLAWCLLRKSEDIEEWISVGDRLPEKGVEVIVSIKYRNDAYIYETNHIEANGSWNYKPACGATITHWRAFSELPKKLR